MRNKRGQEEIVGFVMIMIIVAIVMLVFLGILIRSDTPTLKESSDIYQFLESTMEYTTECEVRFVEDYSSLGELFEECYSGTGCLSGGNACDVLNVTISEIFDSSWNVDPEGLVKGYIFTSFYSANLTRSSSEDEIISLNKGVCEGSRRGATYTAPAFPGRIVSSLTLCYT